jgi:hypothetical protein
MALNHQSFTVGTSATLLVTVPNKCPETTVQIVNDDNNSIYIGDASVATSGVDKGLTVKKDSVYSIKLNAGDKLYGIAAIATGANAVSILYSSVFSA